jgi:hypothetical protein
MGHKDRPPMFVLCRDSKGWRSNPASLHCAQEPTETVAVPRGSLLSPAEPSAFHSKLVTVTVNVRDLPGVRATVSTKEMQEVPWLQAQLLAAVRGPDTRYNLLSSRRLKARAGDAVQYCAPGEAPVTATVRFVGAVPELRAVGHLLGLEAVDPGWVLGDTDGSTSRNRYFNTDQLRGVFCDVGHVRVEDIHCRQRLERLNKCNVETIAATVRLESINNTSVKSSRQQRKPRRY